jgi:hypothetical protein
MIKTMAHIVAIKVNKPQKTPHTRCTRLNASILKKFLGPEKTKRKKKIYRFLSLFEQLLEMDNQVEPREDREPRVERVEQEEREEDHLPESVASLGLRPCAEFAIEFLKSFSDDPTNLELVSIRSGRGAFEALLNDYCGVWPVGIEKAPGKDPFLEPTFATVEEFTMCVPNKSSPLLLFFQAFGPSDAELLKVLKPAGFLILSALEPVDPVGLVDPGNEYQMVRELMDKSYRMQWWVAEFQCTHCRKTRPTASRFWCAVCLQPVCKGCAYGNRCLTCEAKMQRLGVFLSS